MSETYYLGEPDYTVPPGDTLRDELRAIRWSVKKFAAQADIPEATVRGILCGHEAITPLLAKKFERTLKIPSADFWMGLEDRFQSGLRKGKYISSSAYWREESRRKKAADRAASPVHRQVAVVELAR